MTRRFEILDTPISGVKLLKRLLVRDTRGWFERLYCEDELAPVLDGGRVVQSNRTFTRRRGTIRGLHFQRPPHAEIKLVTCLRGRVFDVAVDLRRDSPTFLHWHGEILDAESGATLAIPRGCAHGLQTLADDTEVLYFHTAPWVADAEDGIHPLDVRLAIAWPEGPGEMSARDANRPMLPADFEGLVA